MTEIQKLLVLNRISDNLPNTKIIEVNLPWKNAIFFSLVRQRFLHPLGMVTLRGHRAEPPYCRTHLNPKRQ